MIRNMTIDVTMERPETIPAPSMNTAVEDANRSLKLTLWLYDTACIPVAPRCSVTADRVTFTWETEATSTEAQGQVDRAMATLRAKGYVVLHGGYQFTRPPEPGE